MLTQVEFDEAIEMAKDLIQTMFREHEQVPPILAGLKKDDKEKVHVYLDLPNTEFLDSEQGKNFLAHAIKMGAEEDDWDALFWITEAWSVKAPDGLSEEEFAKFREDLRALGSYKEHPLSRDTVSIAVSSKVAAQNIQLSYEVGKDEAGNRTLSAEPRERIEAGKLIGRFANLIAIVA